MSFVSPAELFARRIRVRRAVLVLLSVGTVVGLWFLAVQSRQGQLVDDVAMQAVRYRLDLTGWPSAALAGFVSEAALAVAAVAVVTIALIRRRVALAVRAVLVLAAANATTQVLKVALERPQLDVGHALFNSYPSGHVTAVASAMVALAAVLPVAARSWTCWAGFLLTALTSVATIALGWHRPADVVSALAVVMFFAMLGLPAEFVRGRGTPWPGILSAVGLLFAAAGIALAVLNTALPDAPVTYAEVADLATTAVPGALLAGSACLLVIAASAALFAAVNSLAAGRIN